MRRNLSVILHPRELNARRDWSRTVCVVADILRATTTIAWMLHYGVARIRVFADARDMLARAKRLRVARRGVVLRGERRCVKVRGMHLGNSPREGGRRALAGRTVWMATTNGTRALLAVSGAKRAWAGSFNTLSAVAEAARRERSDVCIVCAGRGGATAVEDVLFAGMLVGRLGAGRYALDEGARIAYHFYRGARANWRAVIRAGEAAAMLRRAGLQRDIATALRVDSLPGVLPECAKGWIAGG